jgi:hypothetical protein
MSNFLNKIPVSPITSFGNPSVPNGSTIGTNFSILQTGGYMEIYSLSGLTYTIPPATTGVIEFSGNSIPIQFTKGTGSVFSPDVLTLNSDNISSGRRKLGMLVYVQETNKIYQFRIDNFNTLWNNATGATGPGGATVVISDYGTTVKGNSAEGIAFISAWTSSTISGVGGYDNSNSSWKIIVALTNQNNNFSKGQTFNDGLTANTINSGPVIIKDNTAPLLITTTNYVPGLSGNILYFYSSTATTYSVINSRANGGGYNGDLVLQETSGNVGVGKVPLSNFKLDVNGAIGATSMSATSVSSITITANTISANTINVKSTNSGFTPTLYTPFIDNYNRVTLSPGGTPSLTYTNTNSGPGNTTISASTYLNILNGPVAGTSFTTIPLSGFGSPFNPTLSSNSATTTIEWSFNLRTNRGSIFSGFIAGSYGGAVVLAGTSVSIGTTGNGYALIYGGTGTRNWRLVRYTGGLTGTQTDIISGGIFASNTSYVSARIVYAPATNTWSYYFRDDGLTAWGDPTTVNTLIGSAVDSTYTSSLMSSFGVFFNYSTAANQNLQFDNLRVQIADTPPTIPANQIIVKNYSDTTVFNVKDDGSVTASGLIYSPIISGTTISGGTYFGNGSSLTLGQFGTMITGSTALTVTNTTTALTLIPGLTTTITVPTQTMVRIQTNGGINSVGTTTTSGSAIDVALLVDGSILPAGGYQRMYADNPTGNATVTNWVANWNMSVILTLSAGSHTVSVNAVYVAGSNATVSGGAGAMKQGTLTIMILKNT